MTLWLGVALLGALGAALRVAVLARLGAPGGTLVVNLVGTFLLGVLVGADASRDVLLLVGGGLLGALTTFSTWVGEVVEGRSPRLLAGATLAGLGAAALGHVVGAAL